MPSFIVSRDALKYFRLDKTGLYSLKYFELDQILRINFPRLMDAITRYLDEPIIGILGYEPEICVSFPMNQKIGECDHVELRLNFGVYVSGRFLTKIHVSDRITDWVVELDRMAIACID